jgi:hypothetical protein
MTGTVHRPMELTDPRVLPLHEFCPLEKGLDLNEGVDRSQFSRAYGPPAQRTCENGLRWKPDSSHHGGLHEPQAVAGLSLTAGLHWDANAVEGSTVIKTLDSVWKIRKRGYVNVYPNGHVRPGNGAQCVARS